MTDFPFDMIGFDLDGTMLDTAGDIANALNHALLASGRATIPKDAVRTIIGGGAGILCRRALARDGTVEESEANQLNQVMLDYYFDHIAVETRPFPGFVAALDALDQAGVRYATVTNKNETATRKLLSELGLLDRMACVLGGDTLGRENAKPSPALIHEMCRLTGATRAAFVGDTSYDVGAARNAGIPIIICSFGFLDFSVQDLGGDAVIDHFDDLIPTLNSLGNPASAC